MSKDLDLKSETVKKPKARTLLSVRTNKDVQFYGVNGSQLSSTMVGLHIRWDGEHVVVTSDSFPGDERWVFPANISDIRWSTDE